MGSPVSAIIAELVMQEVETMALATSPVRVKWWKRYVDDSNSCMKNDDVNSFHNHLNSINQHIKFTIELPTVSEDGISISFLDTQTTVSPNGEVMVAVHRKSTDTEKYLPFDSHNPEQHKAAVVRTLYHRANVIPTTTQGKEIEKENVRRALYTNGYTSAFINKAINKIRPNNRTQTDLEAVEAPKGYTCIPYVRGISETINRILAGAKVRTAYKPVTTLGEVFQKPKYRPLKSQLKGIVYKFKCKSCDFVYIGESKRSWKSRWAEHKPGTRPQIESAIKVHAETTGHDVCMEDVEILEKGVNNYNGRIFLESLHSVKDNRAINEHKTFPECYLTLMSMM